MRTVVEIATEYIELFEESNNTPLSELFDSEEECLNWHNNLKEQLEKMKHGYLTYLIECRIRKLVNPFLDVINKYLEENVVEEEEVDYDEIENEVINFKTQSQKNSEKVLRPTPYIIEKTDEKEVEEKMAEFLEDMPDEISEKEEIKEEEVKE